MKLDKRNNLIVLYADKGNKITDKQRSFFTDYIYLGKNDSEHNYEEVGSEIWGNFIEVEKSDYNKLLSEIEALKEETDRLKNENTFLTELLFENDYRILQQIEALNNSQKTE